MKNSVLGLSVWLIAAVVFISSMSMVNVPAEAAPAQDQFAAARDGGQLPACPSLFRCVVK